MVHQQQTDCPGGNIGHLLVGPKTEELHHQLCAARLQKSVAVGLCCGEGGEGPKGIIGTATALHGRQGNQSFQQLYSTGLPCCSLVLLVACHEMPQSTNCSLCGAGGHPGAHKRLRVEGVDLHAVAWVDLHRLCHRSAPVVFIGLPCHWRNGELPGGELEAAGRFTGQHPRRSGLGLHVCHNLHRTFRSVSLDLLLHHHHVLLLVLLHHVLEGSARNLGDHIVRASVHQLHEHLHHQALRGVDASWRSADLPSG
mmetsp:Transcript_34815/g.98708  ORF Transcript_34815/g.98708 Transcript_34815/m.98708 type:complete len:254 (-) Transcript_34815:2238-2999(-)